jgi:hypothetical protein
MKCLPEGVPINFARGLGVTRQKVNRLTDLMHATRIDRIDAALWVLGKRLYLNAVGAQPVWETRRFTGSQSRYSACGSTSLTDRVSLLDN